MLSQADRNNQVLGPFGVNYVNYAGRALFDLLDSKGICSAANLLMPLGVTHVARKVISWTTSSSLAKICLASATLVFQNLRSNLIMILCR